MNKSIFGLIEKHSLLQIILLAACLGLVTPAYAESTQESGTAEKSTRLSLLSFLPQNNRNSCKLRGYRPPFNKPPFNRHAYNRCLQKIEFLKNSDF